MPPRTTLSQRYSITVIHPAEQTGTVVFTFVPMDGPHRTEWIVWANVERDELDWSRSHTDPGEFKAEIESEIHERLNEYRRWTSLIEELSSDIESWAAAAGWSARRIPFRMADSLLGKHPIPALLLQNGTCKILLEPVTRSSSQTDGVADLYLMPAYDDIASLYHNLGEWKLHYMFDGDPDVATIRHARSLDLNSETFLRVLSEMERHAEQG